jgi:hypothetical protein
MYKCSFSPLFLPAFLMITILTGVKWNLNVILVYISFMVKDVEHVLIVFIGHLYFSWELSV